jgi:polysaccharide pyruvyl transferase WcaK-like protein
MVFSSNLTESDTRVLFCGTGYGAGNIGDDAILCGLVSAFRACVPSIYIGVVSFGPKKTREETDLDAWWSVGGGNEIEAIKWATHVVVGGGTILSDRSTPWYPIGYCCDLIELSLAYGKPVSMLGVGGSSVETRKAKRWLRSPMGKFVDFVTVRSHMDRQLFIDMGIPESKIKVCADSVFAYSLPYQYEWKAQGRIGVNMTSDNSPEMHACAASVASSLRRVLQRTPSLKLIGICSETRKEAFYDYEIVKSTVKAVTSDSSVVCDYTTPAEFCKLLASMDIVLTMRMHVLAMCAQIGVPCVCIVKEKKNEFMLKELGLDVELTSYSTKEEITHSIERALASPQDYIVSQEQLKDLKNRAVDNAASWLLRRRKSPLKVSRLVRLRAGMRWSLRILGADGVSWRAKHLLDRYVPVLRPRCPFAR